MAIKTKITGQDNRQADNDQERILKASIEDFGLSAPHLWELAFDASPDLISIHDTRHRIVAVNKAMAETLGRNRQELIGCRCHDEMHRTDCPLPSCPHTLLLEDGQAHQAEIYEKRLDTWLLVTVNPLYDEDHRLIGSIHIARNINEQKRDQQTAKENEERFHQLSEATMEGVLLSEDSTIITANQVLSDMTGYSMEELIGMRLFELVAPHQHERLAQQLKNRRIGVHEFLGVRKDGSRFPVQAHARAVTYQNKLVYQTAIRDLTEQKKMEAARINHERLQGVLQMAGAICHEVNQPMMALNGYLKLLESSIDENHPGVEKIRKIENQMSRMKKTIHKLMYIARYRTKAYAGGEQIIDIDQSTIPSD